MSPELLTRDGDGRQGDGRADSLLRPTTAFLARERDASHSPFVRFWQDAPTFDSVILNFLSFHVETASHSPSKDDNSYMHVAVAALNSMSSYASTSLPMGVQFQKCSCYSSRLRPTNKVIIGSRSTLQCNAAELVFNNVFPCHTQKNMTEVFMKQRPAQDGKVEERRKCDDFPAAIPGIFSHFFHSSDLIVNAVHLLLLLQQAHGKSMRNYKAQHASHTASYLENAICPSVPRLRFRVFDYES